jgi:two-component system, LytTR family, sensor kinase
MAHMKAPTGPVRPSPWLAFAALWLGIGLIEACETVFPMRAQGMHHAWLALFVMLVTAWLPWALATPLVSELTRRFPVLTGPSLRGLLLHAGTLALLGLLSASWCALLEFELNPWALPHPSVSYSNLLLSKLSYDVLRSFVAYTLIVVIAEFLLSRDRLAGTQTEAAELRAELSEARLNSLRQQMDPHFIFNVLNSVCGLVRDNQNERAILMLVSMSAYLRNATEQPRRPVATLAEEVELLTQYLDIQKCRFGDRLQVHIDVPAEFLATKVPSLLLQPLAENAIKHGISARADGGAIQVTARRIEHNLQLLVRNSAPQSTPADPPPGLGIGLSNLRARLSLLYRDNQTLKLQRTSGGDVEVRILLPMVGEGVNVAA